MKRLAAAAFCSAVLAAPASGAAPATPAAASWALPQITLVTQRGIFAATTATFRPADPLTAGTLAHVVAALTEQPETAPSDPAAPVTMAQLDATLVRALGLGDSASRFYRGARGAGIKPPARFGTEVVARLLGLRINHPASQDALELQPQETATRAEAAYSVAQILRFDDWRVQSVKDAAASFALPTLDPWQRRILQTATSLIGYPYVWGGESERTEHGFDCSGFVWRVFKEPPYAGAPQLADVLRGRTTYAMSAEVGPPKRIAQDAVSPADVLFFGRGPKSKPGEIDHAGIALGNGWFIHSSEYGVALAPLDDWYARSFAWARDPLAEAGLR